MVLSTAMSVLQKQSFGQRGFVVMEELLTPGAVTALREALERVLRGRYDAGRAPDKHPPLLEEGNDSALGGPGKRTLQIVNIWKSDRTFQAVALSPRLGRLVAELTGWSSVRLMNDQVWAKPPSAAALSFHRDSAYFDLEPSEVCTVWMALDDTIDEAVGPLEYVAGSHLWSEDRFGSAQTFFPDKSHRALMLDAARKQGLAEADLEIVAVCVKAGGAGIHNGRLWHGSGANRSATCPRRGLGLHFVPGDAVFRVVQGGRTLAHRQVGQDFVGPGLPDQLFPVTYVKS